MNFKKITLVAVIGSLLLGGCSSPSYLEYQTVQNAYPDAEIVENKDSLFSSFFVRTKEGEVLILHVNDEKIISTWTIFKQASK